MAKYNYLHGAFTIHSDKKYTNLLRKHVLMLSIMLACSLSYGQNQLAMTKDSITLPDNITLEFAESGEGPVTCLFLHGLGSNMKAHQKLIHAMGSEIHSIAVDYPQSLDSFSLKKYAEIVAALTDTIDSDQLIIVGHSMGAQIAMHFALMYPDKADAFVLIAPAGIETFSNADKNWFDQYVNKSYYKNLSPERIKYSFDINFYNSTMPEDALFMYEDRMAIVEDDARYDQFLDYYLGCIKAMLNEPVFEDLHTITRPVLVVFGQDDRLIPNRILHAGLTTEDILNSAVAVLKTSTAVMVEECGHFAIWDKPEAIAKEIKNFINQYN